MCVYHNAKSVMASTLNAEERQPIKDLLTEAHCIPWAIAAISLAVIVIKCSDESGKVYSSLKRIS